MAEPRDSVTYHRGMVGQLEHDCAIRHTRRFPRWLLHLRQPDAIERAEPEPLVQHIFEHLGIAAAGRTARVEAAESDTPPVFTAAVRRHGDPQFQDQGRSRVSIQGLCVNFTNTAVFGAPNTSPSSSLFGVVPVTQINLPRDVELGFRSVPARYADGSHLPTEHGAGGRGSISVSPQVFG